MTSRKNNPPVTRVEFSHDGSKIRVHRIDIDDGGDEIYEDLKDLPEHFQEKLYILNMLPEEPHVEGKFVKREIDGVGRRINKNIFWLEG